MVEAARSAGASFADVRIETVEEQSLQIQDGELESLVAGIETGFMVRVLVDGAWGMASSNDMDPSAGRASLDQALRLARAVPAAQRVELSEVKPETGEEIWRPVTDPRNVDVEDKQALLADMDRVVREHKEIHSVSTAYREAVVRKQYVDSDGANLRWGLTRSVAQIHFTARRDGHLAGRSTRVGGTKGWELFRDEDPVAKAAHAAEACIGQLGARSAKGGRTTVVIDPELAGVFAHEAVGHASEADLVATGESCFRGRMGEQLGISGLHIHDDSRYPGGFGSIPFDDHGVRAGDKPILRDGVLVGLLADRERAAELGDGVAANGAARAQDFSSRPLVRMSNTLIEPGEHAEEEVFDVKDGIYCRGSRGGQVDTARGTFLFNAQDAFRIENGAITEPLRDVSLTGDILSTLKHIDALGNRQGLGDPGYCGKGQWVPVCDGGPLVRIQDCLVGGAS